MYETIQMPLSCIKLSDHRHPPLGEAARNFCKKMSETFAEVLSMPPEEWEDGFRRDLHPEWEMARWADMARHYEHFTRGKTRTLAEKVDIFSVLIGCVGDDRKAVIRSSRVRCLKRKQVRAIIDRVFKARGGRGYTPVVVGPCRP